MKFSIFTVEENLYILHGQVFVMYSCYHITFHTEHDKHLYNKKRKLSTCNIELCLFVSEYFSKYLIDLKV